MKKTSFVFLFLICAFTVYAAPPSPPVDWSKAGDITADSITTTAADGSRKLTMDSNSAISPTASENAIYFEGTLLKIEQNGTESAAVLSPTAGQVTLTGPTAARSYVIPDRAGQIALIANTFTHDYAGAAVTKAMTAAEASAAFISVTNANAGVELNVPAAVPGKMWVIYNGSGQTLTFKVTGQTGGTIANGKYALYTSNATDTVELMEQP